MNVLRKICYLGAAATLLFTTQLSQAAKPGNNPPPPSCEMVSSCSDQFYALCYAIQNPMDPAIQLLKQRTINGMSQKVLDADAKLSLGRTERTNVKLENIDDQLHRLDEAAKPKVHPEHFSQIHAALLDVYYYCRDLTEPEHDE
jgi:hypothetical protein